jgi:thiol-disulfide isomerase/thioredoxin
MKSILYLVLLIPILGRAQNSKKTLYEIGSGIHFESGLSWQEIRETAKAENKFIFMDCYATWCGPCKFMSDSIFPLKEVGDFMNDHFISVAVQTDQTSKDGDEIRKWYGDAKSIGEMYSISSFPTYLFFSPEGRVVHRVVGATGRTGKDFIARAKEAIDPKKQYYTYIENYKMHLKDSEYLRNALAMTLNSGDAKNAEDISDSYVDCLMNPFHEYNLRMIHAAVRSTKDKGFALFLKNGSRIDSVLHNEVATSWVWPLLAKEEVIPLFSEGKSPIVWEKIVRELKIKYPTINAKTIESLYTIFEYQIVTKEIRQPYYKKNAPIANWEEIFRQIKRLYPGYNPTKMIAIEKPKYYEYRKMWPECVKEALCCLDKYGNQLSIGNLNTFAWNVFMHSGDRGMLSKALEWSAHTIPDSSDHNEGVPEYIDTYANLLYKLGRRENAIFWEKRALGLVEESDSSLAINFRISIDRMAKGESTWKGRNKMEEYQLR